MLGSTLKYPWGSTSNPFSNHTNSSKGLWCNEDDKMVSEGSTVGTTAVAPPNPKLTVAVAAALSTYMNNNKNEHGNGNGAKENGESSSKVSNSKWRID